MTDHGYDATCRDCGAAMNSGGTCRYCWTAFPYIPRALRCACTDTHHYRGSALCPLTPADPWGETP